MLSENGHPKLACNGVTFRGNTFAYTVGIPWSTINEKSCPGLRMPDSYDQINGMS